MIRMAPPKQRSIGVGQIFVYQKGLKMDRTKKSFVAGAAILGIAGLIVKLIGAVYRIPLANIVGQSGMAYYEIAYPYYSWLLVISSAGLPTAISKLVSERLALADYDGAKSVFKTALKLLTGIGIFTTILLFALSSPLARLSGLDGAKYSLTALSPALFFVSVMCAYRGYLQGMQCMSGTAMSQIIEQVGKLIAGFGLAYYFIHAYPERPDLAAMGALIGVSISELMALIVIKLYYSSGLKRNSLPIAAAGRSTPSIKQPGFGRIAKRLLVIAVPITIGASIMPITGIADSVFIINILEDINLSSGLSAAEALESAKNAYTALRSYVTPLINMPAVLSLSLCMSLVPAISAAVTSHNTSTVKSASVMGMKLSMLIGAPCTAGLFVLGGPIMAMLFNAVRSSQQVYVQTQQIMYIAAIGVLFLSLVQTLTGIIQGIGKPHIPVCFLAIGGIVKVASMIVLMKYTSLGILGAALSTVLCYAVAGIADTIYIIVKTRMRVQLFDVFGKPILASLIMGVAVWFVYDRIAATGHITSATLASVIIGVFVYALAILFLRPLNEGDLEFMPKGDKLKKLLGVKHR